MGERLSVGCQRASQSLRAAQAPANHLRSLLHLLPHSPTSPFSSPYFLSLSLTLRSLSLFPFLSLPHCLSLTPFPRSLSLSLFLSVPFSLCPISLSFLPSRAFASPSFPSVPSSPRCSVLQARYNAARRRPSCIFKRAVLLCSRYRPHHLDRPLDDRSPPSPTSVSLPAILSVSPFLRFFFFLPTRVSLFLFLPFFLSHFLTRLLFPCTKRVFSLPLSTFLLLSFSFAVCAHYSYCFHACEPLALFSVHYDAIKNFSGGYVPCL